MLELTRQEHGDEHFVDGSLDVDDGDETKDRVRDIPRLEEPLQQCQYDLSMS